MKFGKRTSKLITLITALLLSSLVVWVFASYIADRQIKISYEITPSVTGHYRLSAFFTDGKNQEVNRKDGNKTLKYEKDLTAGTPTVIEFKKPAGNIKRIYKTELLFEYLTEPRNDVSVKISDIVINHRSVDALYVKIQDPERTLAEKCRADDCKGRENDTYTLNLPQNHAALYLHEDFGFKSYYTHFSIWPMLIIIVVSTGLFYKLIRTILNIRRHQETRIADVVFIVAVLITVFIPVLGVRTDHKVQESNENRMLAEYKPLFTGNANHPVNLNWTKDFEQWFNDRFGGRKKLINAQKQSAFKLNQLITNQAGDVCQKENGWCFRVSEKQILIGTLKNPRNDPDGIAKVAASTDIPIYVLIYPLKTEIYADKVLYVKNPVKNAEGYSTQALRQLSTIKQKNVHLIDVTPIFKKDREVHPDGLVYFIDEHHATEYGNKVVMDYLNQHVPEFAQTNKHLVIDEKYPPQLVQNASGEFIFDPVNDYWLNMRYGQTWSNVFGHANRKTEIPYFKPHSYPFYSLTSTFRQDVTYERDPKCDANIHLHNKTAPQLKVYVIGNSFVETLSTMAATSASDVYRRRINSKCGPQTLKPDSVIKQIKEIKPDVILMAIWYQTKFP